MGHLGRLKHEYRDLARRLGESYMPFPEPKAERAWHGWQEVLEILYRPEDARIAAQMPLRPVTLAQVCERLGMPAEDLKPRLDAMCDRGIVMDLVHPKTGAVRYMLAPPLGGFLEFSMMRAQDDIPKKRMAEALEAYTLGDDTFAREIFARDTPLGRTVAHETALGDEEVEVVDWERASALVEASSARSVSLCYCRHVTEHLGKKCDAPLDNCLSLNSGAEFIARRGFGRAIDKSEAKDILAAARAAGLVQIADNVQRQPVFICNCCGCCCEQLQAINHYGLPAVAPSGFLPVVDQEACKGCGRCARVCPVTAVSMRATLGGAAARRLNVLAPLIDLARCLGCGVCVGACKNRAMGMKRRASRKTPPATGLERVVRMALERGVLGELMFDDGARGGRFLSRIVDATLGLGPVHKAMLNVQLRSRFIRYFVARRRQPRHAKTVGDS